MQRRKIMVIDDDPAHLAIVTTCLEGEGFQVVQHDQGAGALERVLQEQPDLLVLDVVLPFVDGLEICRQVRSMHPVPILMLSSRGDEVDKVLGLGVGADDYLVKPFGARELVARVKALLRRAGGAVAPVRPAALAAPRVLRLGDLEIDHAARTVKVRGQEVVLAAREFDLLWFLASHPRQVFSHTQLMERVWGTAFGDVGTVAVHMKRLRDKVEADPSAPRHLKTVRGVGYKLEADI